MRRARLTVHVSTKLNRSHAVTGARALILPTLGRTERDLQGGGEQFVTVEDSMGMVHASRGRLEPASRQLLSEPAIVCRLARRVLGEESRTPWEEFEKDYATIRDRIARVVPGFEDFNARVADPNGFALPHAPRDERRFPTATGKANFTAAPVEFPELPEGRLLLQTLRSHDQYNTTIYGLNDRYRGVHGHRRVVFIHADDIRDLGLQAGDWVDITSLYVGEAGSDVQQRRAERFLLVAYDIPRGCLASYYPETNPLVPLQSFSLVARTPTSKSIPVVLTPHASAVAADAA
jgi:anaerobic selenocysteine-containing dehydrogenase